MNGFTELVIILTNPEGKKKVTEEAKCNTLKRALREQLQIPEQFF